MLPPDADSLEEAHSAIELWEFYSGKTLDSTQRLTVEVYMAEAGGRWAARTTGREMPRQNGKGDEIEVVELWGLTQRGEAILHTAHELFTVSKAHERLVSLITHRDFQRLRPHILNGMGQQHIKLRANGAEIAYRTRTKGGLRGLDDISRIVVDEAQQAEPEQLASALPTLMANPNPQQNFLGTGAIAGVSAWWWSMRLRALRPNPGAFGYVGHTAERVHLDDDGHVVQPPVDATDRALWSEVNPALCAGRADMEFLEEELRTLGRALFAREHLCVWDPPPPDADAGLIPEWDLLEDPLSRIQTNRCIALDVADGRRAAAFAWAGRRADGLLHVESFDHRPGTAWVQGAAEALARKWGLPIRIQTGSPAASFIDPLREAGVRVTEVSASDQARGLGQLQDAASAKEARHIGDASLSDAVKGGEARHSGDAVVIQRRTGGADVCPIVAVVLAVSGVPSTVRRPRVHSLKEDAT